MPRRPRIDMVGYYHLVNRGVEQRIVYNDDEDFTTFLEMLCSACQLYDVQLHGYVLMSNHYHLLIETHSENLSRFMKHLNASYAIYFNKKYKRSGHLWQGRFKSWYVTDDSYLYTLIGYIENNPIKAKMVDTLGEYPYSSYIAFSQQGEIPPCLEHSFVFKNFKNLDERLEFLHLTVDERILEEINKASNLVVTSIKSKVLDPEILKQRFKGITDNNIRNKIILEAYEEGYSQHTIATTLGVSQPYLSKLIKKMKVMVIT